MKDNFLTRHINTPRTKLYVLTKETCPIPFEYVDLQRRTETNLDALSEKNIRDFWTTNEFDGETNRSLSQPWTGKVSFTLRRVDPGNHYEYVDGRKCKIQATQRPGQINVDVWKDTNDKILKAKWRREWKVLGPQTDKERARRGLPAKIPWGPETLKYKEVMTPLREKIGIPSDPAMPCTHFEMPDEMLEDGRVKNLTPQERWKYFHRTTTRRNRLMAEMKKKTSHLAEPGSGGGVHFATCARLAMNQELVDLNSF